MGSFAWDNGSYLQYHNGRPLSVALTEPCDCQSSPFIQSDFAAQQHARSNSSGRKYKRESYSIYHPNVQYTNFFCSPPIIHRSMNRSNSGDLLIEKLETVTIEQEQCPPMRSYVRTPSPPVRQVKIRSRPASCYDLNNREASDNRWTKYVDERHEEHYNYNYNYNIPAERILPIQREATPPRFVHQNEKKTTTEDFNFHIAAKPAIRPSTKSVGTSTVDLRPLSRSETQVIERYEKDEKVRCDSLTETNNSSYLTTQRPLQRSYDDDDFHDKPHRRASRKTKHKDFVHGMHARNGTISRSSNALNFYSDRERNQLIIRPTSKPREALVDTFGIIAPPDDSPESTIPLTLNTSSRSRYYY